MWVRWWHASTTSLGTRDAASLHGEAVHVRRGERAGMFLVSSRLIFCWKISLHVHATGQRCGALTSCSFTLRLFLDVENATWKMLIALELPSRRVLDVSALKRKTLEIFAAYCEKIKDFVRNSLGSSLVVVEHTNLCCSERESDVVLLSCHSSTNEFVECQFQLILRVINNRLQCPGTGFNSPLFKRLFEY